MSGCGARAWKPATRILACPRVFEELEAGTIRINDPLIDNHAGPFGGIRMSGGCRELGQEGLEEFRATKHVHWDFDDAIRGFWYPYP